MSALPIEPTERDRERFRDLTKAMQFGLEYDRRLASNGDYTDPQTVAMFRLWWSVERERQLLQNLNQSQGVKLTEWENKYVVLANEYQSTCAAANDTLERLEKAESELEAERKRLDWALKKQAYYARNPDRLWVDVGTGNHKWFAVNDDSPRATIDELIAGEPK